MGIRSNDLITIEKKETNYLDLILAPIRWVQAQDPRKTIAFILASYLVLGFTVLGFNRTPFQAIMTTASTMLMEVILCRIFKKQWVFPLSAMITSFSLSILLNYSHDYYVLFIPVFFAIGSKYIFNFNGRHVLNPAQAAVSFSLIFASTLVTSAPAYQWNGIGAMGAFISGLGMFVLVPQVKRFPLVLSFLFFFTCQTIFRAWLMQHHLPFETLFLGTITSPAFFLFTFFMITDPATSPKDYKKQIGIGFLLALFDLIFHIRQSYYTFFYAGLTVQMGRLVLLHSKAMIESGSVIEYIKERFFRSGYYLRPLILGLMAVTAIGLYHNVIYPKLEINNLALKFEEITPAHSSIDSKFGKVLERVDPRIQHLAKWILSVGDSASVGDFDNDGLVDLFLTQPLKADGYRNLLYRNRGNFQFEKIEIPAIAERSVNVEKYGLPSNALFEDYDSDGDLDLFIVYAFGHPVMLQNQLKQSGKAEFVDVTKELGLDIYTNAISANFIDINKDGRLDIIIGNVWPKYLPDYPKDNPRKLNLFDLPQPEYEGDERMFNFMHASWHQADNGGVNDIFIQGKDGKFNQIDSSKFGLPEHYWTLAIGTGDLNRDGWTDLYVANDFGPDNMYYNQQGKGFVKIEGKMFGDVGLDTYKGMNASIADLDNNGWLDVYISNVHHEMQAEGSLLWMFSNNEESITRPIVEDKATQLGALNEDRFGWGASLTDFNNDGLVDIAQANGMVDDSIDKKYENCPDYWYVNEKIARSAPSIHRYVNKWGDIRGYCIYGEEKNRLYLNTGKKNVNMFVDVADKVGMDHETNSRGMAAADFNNDGKMDLVITHQFATPTILKNKLAGERSWIGVDLHSKKDTCAASALGSRVEISYIQNGERKNLMKEMQSVDGFSAQNDRRIHFGLGDNVSQVVAKINWCGNEVTTHKDLKVNQYNKVTLEKDLLTYLFSR